MLTALRIAPWTFFLSGLALVLNAGLVIPGLEQSATANAILAQLEFDREAIASGEVWRLLTANLVHWSAEHFWLDVGTFLVIGMVFERTLGQRYRWTLLASAGLVGVTLLLFDPELVWYRGLSGVCSGQFAIALIAEIGTSVDRRHRTLAILAAVVFATKIAYEVATGQLFFGTEGLGDLGAPTPLAHLAGALGALVMAVPVGARSWKRGKEPEPCGRLKASVAPSARGTD